MAFIGGTSLARDATKIDGVTCEAAAVTGDWVRMSGGVAVRALADSITNSNVIGVIEEKITSTICTVRFLGETLPLYVGLDETKEYYLSPTLPGKMQVAPPTNPGEVVVKLGQPFSATEFLVLKGARYVRA